MKISKKGFSLIEIAIVLIIISLLVVSTIAGKNVIDNAKINLLNNELTNLRIAIKNYINNNNDINNIKISNLIEEKYLDSVTNFDKNKDCYPSKMLNSTCWKIIPNTNSTDYVELGLITLNDKVNPKINKLLCKKFKKRFTEYNLNGSIIDENTLCNTKIVDSTIVYLNAYIYELN